MPTPVAGTAPNLPPGFCALPIYWPDGQSPTVEKTGFFTYPGGPTQWGPDFPGAAGADYDRFVGKWLPVDRNAVSPDGLEYAYASWNMLPPPTAGMAGGQRPRASGALAITGQVHLVDAKTGDDQILFNGSPTYQVVGFTADGIYLAQVAVTMDGNFSSGLYLLEPNTMTITPVPGGDRKLDRSGWTVVNGSAFGVEFSGGGGITAGNELVELDLNGAGPKVWLTLPDGTGLGFLGVDAQGRLLVSAFPSGSQGSGSPATTPPIQLLALTDPQHATVLWSTTDQNSTPPFGPAVPDQDRTWLGGFGEVWLVTSTGATRVPAFLNSVVRAAGGCQVS